MTKLLAWVPISGLGMMLLILLYGCFSQKEGDRPTLGDKEKLTLILKDYEEQVEMLIRWLQLRRKWLPETVELEVAVTDTTGDTQKILERLHKKGGFEIVELLDCFCYRSKHNNPVMKLDGRGANPIPWAELERNLRGFAEKAS